MVFWAREKIKNQFEQARREGETKGEAKGMAEGITKGAAKANRAWRAWYERMQAAQLEGRPFNEPPPDTINAGEQD